MIDHFRLTAMVKRWRCISLLLVSVISSAIEAAPVPGYLPSLLLLTESDIREAAIAFVNMSTSPGLEAATLTVDNEERTSEQVRGSLGFAAEFTIKDHIFNGYWGLAIVAGELDDKIKLVADSGEPVKLDMSRNVLGLRGSFGLSFPLSQHFKFRSYLSLAVSDLETEGIIDGLTLTDSSGNTTTVSFFESNVQMGSAVGSLDAI